MPKQGIFTESTNSSIPSQDRVETIWKENAPQIYKLCSKWSKSSEAADDLFQEVALKFCRNVSSLDSSRSLYSWFAKVVRNTHYDEYRKHRDRVLPMSFLAETEEDYDVFPSSAGLFFHDEYRDGRIRRELDFLMSELEPYERLAVEFSHIGGVPLNSVCQIFGMSRSLLIEKRKIALEKMRKKKQERQLRLENMDAPPVVLEDLLTNAS